MQKITIVHNILDEKTWKVGNISTNPCEYLYEYFDGKWPATARIYQHSVSKDNDVTPYGQVGINNLMSNTNDLWVLVYPGEATAASIGVNIGISVLQFGISWLVANAFGQEESISDSSKKVIGSPNNKLGDRKNVSRLGSRVPDIVGTIRSTPDLIAKPYIIYDQGKQIEIATMCVGRGEHSVSDIRDGDVAVSTIPGMSVEVYDPFQVPKTGSFPTPATLVGDPIGEPIKHIFEAEDVDGIELHPFNEYSEYSAKFVNGPTRDLVPVEIEIAPGGATAVISLHSELGESENITNIFTVDTKLMIDVSTTGADIDFSTSDNGTEPFDDVPDAVTITSVAAPVDTSNFTTIDITVSVPASLQATWESARTGPNALGSLLLLGSGYDSIIITPLLSDNTANREILLNRHTTDFQFSNREIICNFVYPNGLTATDGNVVKAHTDVIEVIVKEGGTGVPALSAPISQIITTKGKNFSKDSIGFTVRIPVTFTGDCTVMARRIRLRPRLDFERQSETVENLLDLFPGLGNNNHTASSIQRISGTLEDTLLWTHCYDTSEPAEENYGDITTIITKTRANDTTRKIKERKLSCLASRRLKTLSGGSVNGTLSITGSFINHLFYVLTDPLIGNIPEAKIDIQGFEDTKSQLDSYFNYFGVNSTFGYTFDNIDSSLEETVNSICNSCFAKAYRDGDIFKIRALLPEETGTLLLNHRNVLPDTQKIVHTFGVETENDSIEIPYTGSDGIVNTVVVPEPVTNTASLPATAILPRQTRKVDIAGIQTRTKALWHAIRIYNKMVYSNQKMTLSALEEAALLVDKDRVLVADRTRVDAQDGYIVNANGVTLETSQPVDLSSPGGYTIFLQHSDGTTESMEGVLAGVGDFEVVLPQAPAVALVTDETVGVQTNYMIVENLDSRPNSFILEEKEAESPMVWDLTFTNYTNAYYFGDSLVFWAPMYTAPSATSLNVAPNESQDAVTEVTGTFSLGNNVRGLCWNGNGSNSITFSLPIIQSRGSYTKSMWIIPTTDAGCIYFRSDSTTDEIWSQIASNQMVSGHNGAITINYDMTADIAAAGFHHYCITYDDNTGDMTLFHNGVQVQQGTAAAQAGAFSDHIVFQNLDTQADEPMIWNRCLLPEEVKHLFQRTIRSQDWV